MIACAQEIVVNGFESKIVPDSISDWICGKVMRSLPKRLSSRLLSYLIDNRDLEGTIDFRENEKAHVKELTLLVYNNKELKETDTKENINNLDKVVDLDENMFCDKNLTRDGLSFYSEEIVLDHQQIVPYLNPKDNSKNQPLGKTSNSWMSNFLLDKRSGLGHKMRKNRENVKNLKSDSENDSDDDDFLNL